MGKAFIEGYWTEKYRPKIISDDLILNNEMKEKFKEYVENKNFPHLLFVGPPGTGKTTVAMALIRQIIKNEMDVLFINGSVDNGIDIVRERIMPYLNTPPRDSNIKIVFIDECDFLTANAFASLRATIEQPLYNKNLVTRFIFTANYVNKIPLPIISRFTVYTLDAMSKEEIYKRCVHILNEEKIKYNKGTIDKIIEYNYPDMRSIIKVLQSSSQNGELNESTIIGTPIKDIEKLISNLILSNNYQECMFLVHSCRQILTDDIDVTMLIKDLMDKYVDDLHTHSILFKYYNLNCATIIPRHTVIAMMHEILLNKFDLDYR